LTTEGYIGCIILTKEETSIHNVTAEVVATGWIKNGNGGCINDMLITRGTTKCLYSNNDGN